MEIMAMDFQTLKQIIEKSTDEILDSIDGGFYSANYIGNNHNVLSVRSRRDYIIFNIIIFGSEKELSELCRKKGW